MAIDEARDDEEASHYDEAFHGDDALERSAAYDELLRSGLSDSACGTDELDFDFDSETASEGADVPAAGIIRLLHEVFRGPRGGQTSDREPPLERVGRFIIHRMLGRGAFGRVYLAHDPILRRQVALKVFHQHLLADESTRRHVLREREIMARLQHPNIVPVWEAGEENELLYIASEYCPGPTLAEWLGDRKQRVELLGQVAVLSPESLRQSAGWIGRLADAVQHSHERGVVHRDLKPGNVLLEPQGQWQPGQVPSQWRPRLTDFGLAKYFHAVSDETRSGLFIGSLEYASPEQVRGQPDAVGPPSDIYSLGVLLYELLTDELPHRADSDYDLARKICDRDVVFRAEHRRALPRDLQAIALRALEREPRNRYASAAEMRDDLQRFLSGEFVTARHVSLPERAVRCARKNPDVAALSGLCICFALLLAGVLVYDNQQLAVHSEKLKQALFEARTHEFEAQIERSSAQEMQQRAEQSERQARQVGYRANMRLAYEAWEKNNLTDVRELLERAETQAPALRSADWYLLQQELAARYKWLPRLKDPVYGLAYHPGAEALLTVNELGQVRRWDLKSKSQTDVFQTSAGPHALTILPDHKTVALGEWVGEAFGASKLTLWDLDRGQLIDDSLHSHSTTLESIEYSPDGKWIASGSRYQPVVISNRETGRGFVLPSSRRNTQLAFSPSGDRLAVNGTVLTIEIYDLATREVVATIDTKHFRIASYAWLPGREIIAISAREGCGMLFYSTRTGKLVASVPTRHTGESLTASADGRALALGSEEGRLQVVDLSQLEWAEDESQVSVQQAPPIDLPPSHQFLSGFVTDIAFVGASRVAAADDEGNLACLDLAAHAYRRIEDNQGYWTSARWKGEDSLTFFSSDRGPELRSLTDAVSESAVAEGLDFLKDVPLDLVHSRDGKLQAAFTRSGELAVIDSASGQLRFRGQADLGNALNEDGFMTLCASISSGNALVFTTGENRRLTAWNAADGTVAWDEMLTNSGSVIAEDPATGRLFVGGGFETLRIYDGRTGTLLDERSGGNGTKCLVIDSVHQRIVSGHYDGTLRIRPLDLSQRATIHRTHGAELTALTLSRDGRTILSGDATGIIRIWLGDGQPLGVIYRSAIADARVRKFVWSPSGEQVAALIAGRDGASELVCWQVIPKPAAAGQ